MRRLLLAAALASAGAAAHAAPAPPLDTPSAPAPRTVIFLCDDGARPTVRFADGTALLISRGRRWRLTQEESGSGIRYEGQGQTLRGKGPDLTWTSQGGARQCRATSPLS